MTKSEELKTQIARGVLRAPDINPKNGEISTYEVLFTLRPGWSDVGKYETALPGGRIKKEDFQDLSELDFEDPGLVLTMEQMMSAGISAVERQVLKELGLTLVPGLLAFVDNSTNKEGWTTWAYVADLEEKPTVQVKPESAGTRWMDEQKILKGNPRMLSGHLGITRRSLKKISE